MYHIQHERCLLTLSEDGLTLQQKQPPPKAPKTLPRYRPIHRKRWSDSANLDRLRFRLTAIITRNAHEEMRLAVGSSMISSCQSDGRPFGRA